MATGNIVMDRHRKCKRVPFTFQVSIGPSEPIPIFAINEDDDEDDYSSSPYLSEPIDTFTDFESNIEETPTTVPTVETSVAALQITDELEQEEDDKRDPSPIGHVQSTTKVKGRGWCRRCDANYKTQVKLFQHCEIFHKTRKNGKGPRSSNRIKIKRDNPSRLAIANIGCKDCILKFETFADLGEHQREEHKEKEETAGLNRDAKNVLKSNITSQFVSGIQSSKRVHAQGRYTRRSPQITKENVKNKLSTDIVIGVPENNSIKTDNLSGCECGDILLSSEYPVLVEKQDTQYWDRTQ